MTDYVIMPESDYESACRAIRAKTGKTDLIKSGDMAEEIAGIETGIDTSQDTVIPPAMLEGITAHDAEGNQIVGTIPTYDASTEESRAIFQEKTVTMNGEITPDDGYVGLSKVTVDVPTGGGGAAFNIHYGMEAPEDTSKLWVETDTEPTQIRVMNGIAGDPTIETISEVLPTRAYGMASATVGKKVYLFGGRGSSLNTYRNDILVFDTVTNTISKLDVVLPYSAFAIACGVVGTKIYLFGGYTGGNSSNICVFDTETNTIEKLSTSLPTGGHAIAAGVVGTDIYLFGGSGSDRSNKIRVFNTEAKTISNLSTTLPKAIAEIGVGVIGEQIYLFGGDTGSPTNTIMVFDTTTKTIETLPITLPKTTAEMGVEVVGTKVYLFGGGSVGIADIMVFDAAENTVETLSVKLPTIALGMGTGLVGTNIYLLGGYNYSDECLSTINVFKFAAELAENAAVVAPSLTKNVFPLMDAVELGVSAVYIGNSDGKAEQVNAYLYNGTEWMLI